MLSHTYNEVLQALTWFHELRWKSEKQIIICFVTVHIIIDITLYMNAWENLIKYELT